MCITGSLTDFSLPEIFRLLGKGHHTGLLTVNTDAPTAVTPNGVCYIWVYRGRIVAVDSQLEYPGLIKLIAKRQWMDRSQLAQLRESVPQDQPLGSYLQKQGLLTMEQVKWLFQAQVLRPTCTLFQLKAGHFKFNHEVKLPMSGMTGLSLSTLAANLLGLRALGNWNALGDKLPDANGGLLSITGYPRYPLNALESQVWEYTSGTVSLREIAKQLRLSVKTVQQIAFRLMTVGLVEEVPLVIHTPCPQSVDAIATPLHPEATDQPVSHSFLHNLMGFLADKSKHLPLRAA
ncbi:MAG: DUF4388 domain-containing protein [Coleofasciculus sp. G1-WW12-02]|uniref:DUF4388 domain-containing protein n=1 Tax=unclassified Coleofasciculus TaxID=2692782 RepID=UPI0032F99F5B